MSTRRLRPRLSTTTQPPPTTTAFSDINDSDIDSVAPPITTTRKRSPRIPLRARQRARSGPMGSTALSRTLASTAYLANLLPTGTHLAFQLLTPVFTNNGNCDTVTSTLTLGLLAFLAASCFLASLTDSFRSPEDGHRYYGLATPSGMWLFDYPDTGTDPDAGPDTGTDPDAGPDRPDLRPYRLRMMDWAHAVMSVLVFGAVALRDGNVVGCLYPHPTRWARQVLDIMPIGVGTVCGLLFVAFPMKRHGIGYPGVIDDGL